MTWRKKARRVLSDLVRTRLRQTAAVLTSLVLTAGVLAAPARAARPDQPTDRQRPAPVAAELAATVKSAAGDRVQALLMLRNPQRYDGDPDTLVDRLKAFVAPIQQEVEIALEEQAATRGDVRVLNRFWITNMLLVEFTASPNRLTALAETPGVQEVLPNFTLTLPDTSDAPTAPGTITPGAGPGTTGPGATRSGAAGPKAVGPDAANEEPELTWGLERIGAHRVWTELGLDGSGVRVVTLDTGVAINHPDLAGKMATDNPADPRYPGGWMEFDSNGNLVASQPHDSAYHGTHVAGTIHGGATSGTAIGVAPGAEMAHGLVIPGGSGTFAQVAAGMQWAIAPTDANGNPAGRPADVVSMSLGAASYNSTMIAPTRAIVAAGAFPAFAIGNSPCGVGTASPGNVYEAVGIGATDADDNVASFSCGGVVPKSGWSDPPADWPDSYVKPDLSAPGVGVLSADPNGGYRTLNGTSMATPHTSGTVALLRQGAPELSVAQLRQALVETAVWDDRYADQPPDTRYGHGRIDAYAAATRVALDSGITGVVTRAGSDTPVAGARVSVTGSTSTVVTDEDGRYTLRLPAGTYTVTASAFGHESATVADVRVTDEQFTEVNIALTALPVGTISGKATFGPSGHGIPGVTVSVREVPGGLSTTTNVDGAYSITVPAGTYTVSASHPQFTGGPPVEVTVTAGDTVTQDFTFAPPPQKIAYVGSYGQEFIDEVFAPRNISVDLFSWDRLTDAAAYPLVILGYGVTSNYNADRFQAFLDATDAAGSGVIFLDHAFTTGNGLRQLSMHTGQPASTGSDTGGTGVESFYEIIADHPIFAGFSVGDRIPIDTQTTKWIAWFDGYSGDGRKTIANIGRTDSGGIYGGGIGVDQRATNRHVLMSSHGASATRGPADWTPEAEQVFLNAVAWAARPADEDQPYFAAHSLQVSPEVVKADEQVTVRAQVKNVGVSSGSYQAVLRVDGQAVDTSTATIASGANRQYTWTVSGDELGSYRVEFAHLSGAFRVRPPRVTLTARTVDAPGAARPGPLADATVELIHDGRVLPVGVTDADGRLTFDTPAATGRYTLVVRRPKVGDADAYLLHRVITVIDDDEVTFAPRVLAGGIRAPASIGENFAVRANLAAASVDPQHSALVYLRPATTAPWGYAYPAGTVVATLDHYEAVAVHTVTRLERDWWLPSEIIRDLDWIDPFDVTFAFGGDAKVRLAAAREGTTSGSAKVRVDWDVTDAFGHPYATVLATGIRPFADLPEVLALEDVLAAVRREAPQEQLPILRLFAPDGTPLRAGSIGWNAQPFTFDVADPQPGRYRIGLEVDTGNHSGRVSAETAVVLLDRPVVRTSYPKTAAQDTWLRHEVGVENPSPTDLGQVTWTVTIAQDGTALKPKNVALQLRVGDTWEKVVLTASGGKLVGTVVTSVDLAPGAAHGWQLRARPKVSGTLTITNSFRGDAVNVSATDTIQVAAAPTSTAPVPTGVVHRVPL